MTRARDIADRNVDSTTIDGVDSTQLLRSDVADTKTAGDLSFADSVKAQFGASNDLQIYHDGSNSYILDTGTGGLYLKANADFYVQSQGTDETFIQAASNAFVKLFFNGSEKLATTSTGIDVTGVVNADSGTHTFGDGTNSSQLVLLAGTTGTSTLDFGDSADNNIGRIQYEHSNDALTFRTNNSEAARITSGGNVGIGESSPNLGSSGSGLHITGASSKDGTLKLDSSTANYSGVLQFTENGTDQWRIAYDPTNNHLEFTESGVADRMVIADGGNVGIGAAPNATFGSTLYVQDTPAANKPILSVYSQGNSNNAGIAILNDTGNRGIWTEGSNMRFTRTYEGNSTADMTITSGGEVLIGKTASDNTTEGFRFRTTGEATFVKNSSSGAPIYVNRQGNNGTAINFGRANSQVGTITVNTSGTTYNTTSDRRLKTDIQPIADATDKLMQMQPVTHKWIAEPDADAVHGFIAQDMQQIVPEAVSGEDGGEEMMSMDYGRITPVLVAALQDAHRKIEQLEQRITEMENN